MINVPTGNAILMGLKQYPEVKAECDEILAKLMEALADKSVLAGLGALSFAVFNTVNNLPDEVTEEFKPASAILLIAEAATIIHVSATLIAAEKAHE